VEVDTGEELARLERLEDVVFGAGDERCRLVLLFAGSSEEDERDEARSSVRADGE
jgi:hypothetical protein